MVSTRHSLPSADAVPSPVDPKTEKALKKLQILGNDALKGDMEAARKAKEKQAVYHFRGAVYAIEDNTLSEWVENQPKRYQKRTEEDATAGAEGESEAEEAPPAKRTRKSLPHQAEKAKKGAVKGARRNTMPAKPTRKRKEPAPQVNNSRLFDFTAVGGADERVISAKLPSWIAPSREEREAKHGHRWRPTAKKSQLRPDHEKLRSEIAEQKAIASAKNYTTTPIAHTRGPLSASAAEHRETLNSLVRLAAVRKQLTAAKQEFAQAKALLQLKQSEQHRDSPAPSTPEIVVTSAAASDLSAREIPATSPILIEDDIDDSASMPPPARPSRTPATGANASPSAEPEENTLLGSISPSDAPRHSSEAPHSMPQFDKNGNALRWSLYAASPEGQPGAEAGHEGENQIEYRVNRDRLPAETRSQKRRRVSREIAIVKGWAKIGGGKVVTEGAVGGLKELKGFGDE